MLSRCVRAPSASTDEITPTDPAPTYPQTTPLGTCCETLRVSHPRRQPHVCRRQELSRAHRTGLPDRNTRTVSNERSQGLRIFFRNFFLRPQLVQSVSVCIRIFPLFGPLFWASSRYKYLLQDPPLPPPCPPRVSPFGGIAPRLVRKLLNSLPFQARQT